MTRTLFGFHVGSNAGYAMLAYEKLFYRVGLALAEGDASALHFGYHDLDRGFPAFLPKDFKNATEFNFDDRSPENIGRLAEYCRAHSIELVVLVDFEAKHPLASALRKVGVKKVVAWWGAPVSGLVSPWKLILKKLEIALSRSNPDMMVFESNAMVRTATHGRGIPAKRTALIRQGVDIERFKPGPGSRYVHEALGFPLDRKVVIFTGHMEERKGVRVLVRAAIELLRDRGRQDVCFLICGNRPGESEVFEKLYEGLGLDAHIRFGGYRDDLPRIYPSAYCGVTPTTGWDSFPYGAIEMAACGLPMVASNLQGLAESVLDGQTGFLFEPGNHQELADKIERLLDNPELAARLGRAGRDRCEAELNLDAHYRRTLEFLRRTMEA